MQDHVVLSRLTRNCDGRMVIRLRHEELLDLTVLLWFLDLPLRAVIVKLGIPSSVSPFAACILIYAPLFAYIYLERRLPWKYFHWVFLFCALFFGVTLLIHPDYISWYTRDIYGVMYTVFRPDHGAVWAFLMIELAGSYSNVLRNLKRYAVVLFFYNLIQLFQAIQAGHWTSYNLSGQLADKGYSLDFGYNMIFVTLVVLVCFLEKKQIRYLILCGIIAFLVLQYGSRGAFLCAIVFFLLYLITRNKTVFGRIKCSAGIGIAGIAAYFFGTSILQAAASFLIATFHISSRTLVTIANGKMMDDNGRDKIYELAREAIWENPVFGQGAYGDRPFVGRKYYWGYSHSIVYEMMVDFGVVLGSIILIFLLYKALRTILTLNDRTALYTVILVFSMCMRLAVSDTFWGNNFFWMMLALIFSTAGFRDTDRNESCKVKLNIRCKLRNRRSQAMFLHILGSGSMFTKDTYKMLSTRFPKEQHCFVGNFPDYDEYMKLDGCRIIQSKSLKMLQALYQADYIIVHGLFNKTVIILLALQPWLLKKCNWVIWGADIYSHKKKNKSFQEKMLECMKKFIGPKFHSVSILSEADLTFAKEWYGVKGKTFKVSYPVPASNSELTDALDQQKKESGGCVNILVGNSATETNQHFEALDILAKFKDDNIRIYLPLSYGNADFREYGKRIADYAHSIFGDKAVPLTEKMAGDEYLRFLNTIHVGIFNNNRQQAMGNISQATLCGAKVYIRSDTSMWDHFKNLGYTLYKVEDIRQYTCLEELTCQDSEIVKRNSQIVKKLHDIDRKVKMWSEVFNGMQNEGSGK